jgi:hypothetical protein
MENTDKSSLDQQLLDAHEENDHPALALLYAQAADKCEQSANIDAACFYLTHAYVFALQEGMAEADALRQRLVKNGRED